MWSILVVLVLWALVGPILALVVAGNAGRRLRDLEAQIRALETRLAGAALAPATVVATAAGEPIAAPQPIETAPVETPEPAADAAAEPLVEDLPAHTPAADGAPTHIGERLETLEGRIGGRWSVLVGGLALALGAVFLVRYSIEQGLLGPGTRIMLGLLLAAALLATGERLRRRDRAEGAPAFAKADVPAILTGAGAIAAFATIYAAHALYGFIGTAGAFLLLTAAGLATLFLSVVHGPALAALGVLGSYAAPLLVASAQPKPFPVVLHTLAVTAAVLALARLRGWSWLAAAGIGASLVWGLLTGGIGNVNTVAAELLLLAGLAATYAATLIAEAPPAGRRDRERNPLALAGFAGLAALSVYFALVSPVYPPLVAGILLVGFLGAAASRWTSVAEAALVAGALAVATIMLLRVPAPADLGTMQIGAVQWRILGTERLGAFALKAVAVAALIGLGAFLSADRLARRAPRSAGMLAAAGAAAPLLILVVVYLRHVPFETRPPVGIAALALAGIFAGMTERLVARRPGDVSAPAPAFYAAGAVLALSFAMGVGLATRFIPLALSLGAAGIVWVGLHRPVRVLPWLAVLTAALACVALVAGPPLSTAEIGTTPLLNGLVLRFGLPAAFLLLAGEMQRRRGESVPAGFLQAAGLALAAAFVALEIRHLAQDGDLAAGAPGLGEQSAYTLAALAFSLGLQRIAAHTGDGVYRAASLVLGVAGAALIAVAHLVTVNPFVTDEDVGARPLINLLLPGYLLPALLAASVAAAARGIRPRWYVRLQAGLALLLGFAFVTLTVRHAFHGPRFGGPTISDAETWTYSAVWLGFGIALLAAGIWRRSAALRTASGIVIAAVVCKVFLLDMAALTGALRALSFLGLGAALIAIGRLYQRLLARAAPPDPAPA